MTRSAKTIIQAELERIRKRHGGLLRPVDVVMAATPEDHPLHDYFEWDGPTAAHAYRLWQARQLIMVSVTVLPGAKEEDIRAYVSLTPDRSMVGGGYRALGDVLNDEDLTDQMLTDALSELRHFERKYRTLKALAPVFRAIVTVEKKKARK